MTKTGNDGGIIHRISIVIAEDILDKRGWTVGGPKDRQFIGEKHHLIPDVMAVIKNPLVNGKRPRTEYQQIAVEIETKTDKQKMKEKAAKYMVIGYEMFVIYLSECPDTDSIENLTYYMAGRLP